MGKISDQEDSVIIREICSVNGISYENLPVEGRNVKVLEMFFSGMPRIPKFHHFLQLRELVIVSQSLNEIENLHYCPNLVKLWICECELTEISNVHHCSELLELFLYDNKISKIQNLSYLHRLKKLWLNDNQICAIEGLEELRDLVELNLSGNEIERVGNSLEKNSALETLYLSGNKLYMLKDLIHLARLPNLKNVSFNDPQYKNNPVCCLPNYSTFVLYHLPCISRLDSFDVSGKHVKDIAENVVMKKKMFYFMKVCSINRTLKAMRQKLMTTRDSMLRIPYERLKDLARCTKELQRELHNRKNDLAKHTRDCDIEELKRRISKIEMKLSKLEEHSSVWHDGCKQLDSYFGQSVDHIKSIADLHIKFQMLEIESGGNIRIEEGSINNAWFKLCGELLAARFCVQEFQNCGIIGIRVNKVYRIHDTLLQFAYDSVVNDALDEMSASSGMDTERLAKKYQEYMFWCPKSDNLSFNHISNIFQEGFGPVPKSDNPKENEGIFLTNSLNIADRNRLTRNFDPSQEMDPSGFDRVGRIMVTKVFVGKNVIPLDEQPVRILDYANAWAGHRNLRRNRVSQNHYNFCECSNRQSEYFVFKPDILLPEYILEYEYLTDFPPVSPFYHIIYPDSLVNKKVTKHPIFDVANTESEVLKLPPVLPIKTSLTELTVNYLLSSNQVVSLEQITHLDLCCNSLKNLVPMNLMLGLKTLNLSFNEISGIEEINCPNIEVLDLSFNCISSLDGMHCLQKLKKLDLSWNNLSASRESVSILRKATPSLSNLSVHHNPWQKEESLRLRIIGRMKYLIRLDNQPVSEGESAAALRMVAGSRISQVILLTHARTDTFRPKCLSLSPMAQTLHNSSRHRIDRSLDEPDWELKITSIALDGQHISKISNLERMENLRYLSLCNNDITKIEGLEHCLQLEELSLEDNCISKVENISYLSSIKRLFLGSNYITTLHNTDIKYLCQLETIVLDTNQIASLQGIENCTSLLEIYAANNKIADSREVFYLKGLHNLIILDLYGNTLTNLSSHYRLSIIFHLKTLKALDGVPVELNEINMSKELLGGKLTSDFLIEKQGHDRFYEIRELDFPNCSIKSVELTPSERFINLRSLNLENNSLTSFSGLIHLSSLRVLCLSNNNIESIFPKSSNCKSGRTLDTSSYAIEKNTPILENLEVLHLANNGIKDLVQLDISRISSLKALFLQGNEIVNVEGLDNLQDLRELVLDRNKIKGFSETSFSGNWNLTELHVEENRIKELHNLHPLDRLTRLFLGSNRIQDFTELDRLDNLTYLVEISLVNNPISRRSLHRQLLIHKLPRIQIIDGLDVSDEEREKAEYYFNDQQSSSTNGVPVITTVPNDVVLPGIITTYKSSVPVRVTNVNLGNPLETGGHNSWYEPQTSQPVSSASNTSSVNSNKVTNNAARLRAGIRLPPGNLQPPSQPPRQIYYYDPSGHVEPTARWGYNKRK